MNKKWLIVFILIIALIIFWILGGLDSLLGRTVFAPDYEPEPVEEVEEPIEEPLPLEVEEPSEEVIKYSASELSYQTEIVGDNLEIPWEIVPLPDGRILVTERPGRVVILGKGEIFKVEEAEHTGEAGLLGAVLSPDFSEDKHIYLYYTYRSGNGLFNRVSRFILEDDTLKDEEYILDGIPGSRFHNGGRIKFGPDGNLYVTTGDAQETSLSQNVDSLAGKILRMNPDGSVPEDNPFGNSLVYAYGLRNPQGLSWNPVTGDLYASDHGPNSQDEVNHILPGKNYGWPIVTCTASDERFEDPLVCYSEYTMAPSGVAFLPWDELIESPLYVAGLRGNILMRLDLNDEGTLIRREELFTDLGRIRTVIYHEGSLYIATNNRDGRGVPKDKDDVIIKITPIR
ncbi:PQQ-dependent sugar dehydrogenase [Gudongella oleilytica]|uniref:PQQ-dependent sugar dehydrogenase n=1 Tax=Gudongella oleilytica TaxID=1582259 RepID=UPI002A36C55D|nr:PQQ-dependent sugar dehydrogenase [Gudongella oleilytica]MDY0257218.1 PQQ-dependent sugar dehydrogenase [Gudongella oleilytica]